MEANLGFSIQAENGVVESVILQDEVVWVELGVGSSLARVDSAQGRDVPACSLRWKIHEVYQNL